MCMKKNNQSNEKEKACSTLFWWVIIGAVLVCLVGMIYCCISFSLTSAKFSEECRNALLKIQSFSASDNPSATPSDSSSDMLSDNPSVTPSDKIAVIDSVITHMENMVAIQKSGMTNDLMSFIYGILSAILVGLCATFVVKSRTNADEVKKTADKAQLQSSKAAKETKDAIEQAQNATKEAKNSAEAAKKQAAIAEAKANATEKAIEQAQNATEEAKRNAEVAKAQAAIAEEKANSTEKAIKQAQNAAEIAKELRYQVRLIIISGRIVSAKAELLGLNYISANRAITQIRNEILSLFSDDEFKRILESSDYDSMEIGKVYDELLDLQQNVDDFMSACEKKYTGAALKSMESAAENYQKWIQLALNCMDALSSEMRTPVK